MNVRQILITAAYVFGGGAAGYLQANVGAVLPTTPQSIKAILLGALVAGVIAVERKYSPAPVQS